MKNEEIKAVSNLPAPKRYEYFIKKVADFEEVWGLFEDGWAISEDENGSPLFPFWPKKEFANLCAIHEWNGYRPKKIDLEEFIEEWLPGMDADGIRPSIFWNNTDSAVLETHTLKLDLEEELNNY
ncbi:hypothetical protein GCM10007063_16610 [Lentibacillus kapialis]|uniref:DUF2750 domain-containing protein n=1 Tax=Lentibacillus kapialis TaxID=340214 RepID=A0A917UY11_9BACI|nr:DUF2750 domain-containing protein [Lentibacillus kapialis]GGJ94756.1 hypothetical protein GCM10007063_16610 [Lentibacillus kapialis]